VQYSLHAMLLSKVSTVHPFYKFLLYAVILHSCSYVAHIIVAEAQCCRECPLSCFLWMFSGVTDSLYTVHIQYTLWCYCPLSALFTFFHLAKSYKMTFQRQEKSRKVALVGQNHLRNPEAAENGFLLLSWDCIIKKQILNLPGFQYFRADRMSLVSPPSSNG
jgi:hypothetical protein